MSELRDSVISMIEMLGEGCWEKRKGKRCWHYLLVGNVPKRLPAIALHPYLWIFAVAQVWQPLFRPRPTLLDAMLRRKKAIEKPESTLIVRCNRIESQNRLSGLQKIMNPQLCQH